MSTNTDLAAEIRAGSYEDRAWMMSALDRAADALEAAEAELTRRDTVIEHRVGAERIFADADLERFETVAGPISRSTVEAEKASKYLVSDLAQWVVQLVADVRKRAAAPGLSEAAIMEDERVMAWLEVADHDAFKGCYDAEVPLLDAVMDRITALVDMESTIADLAAAPVSLEAVKAETTTEWQVFSRVAKDWCRASSEGSARGMFRDAPGIITGIRSRQVTEWRPVETEGDNRG